MSLSGASHLSLLFFICYLKDINCLPISNIKLMRKTLFFITASQHHHIIYSNDEKNSRIFLTGAVCGMNLPSRSCLWIAILLSRCYQNTTYRGWEVTTYPRTGEELLKVNMQIIPHDTRKQQLLDFRLLAKYAKTSKARDKMTQRVKWNNSIIVLVCALYKYGWKGTNIATCFSSVLFGAHYTFHYTALQTRLDWNNIEQKVKLERLLPWN